MGQTRAQKLAAEAAKRSADRIKKNMEDAKTGEETSAKEAKAAEKKAAEKAEPADHKVKRIDKLPEAIKEATKLLHGLTALHKKKHFILEFASLKDGGYQVSCHENGDIE